MDTNGLGGRPSLDDVICAYVREVVNTTESLGEASDVLKKNPRWLHRYRESHHLGKPQRQSTASEDHAETFLDD